MMEKMIALQQKRRSKKGGFTLVELIVVLVILAILAALLIPALTGYIDRAKEKSAVAETRQIVMAAQTITDEVYGAHTDVAAANLKMSEVQKLSEVTITKSGNKSNDTINVKDGKVVYVKHVSKNGKTGYYTAEGGCTASSQTEIAGDVAFTDDLK